MKLELKEVVQRYLAAAGAYGVSLPFGSLGLSQEEVEDIFSTLDEDYHISRFFHLVCGAGTNFDINGFPQTHVSIDSEIQTIL